MSDTIVFWFRRDLRLSDNAALIAAAKTGQVLPIYVLDEGNEFKIGGASQWWLHHTLADLNKSLDGKMLFFKGDARDIVPKLAKQVGAKGVYWNRCYEPGYLKGDARIEKQLNTDGIATELYDGTLLWGPGETVKKDGTPFKVYKPFLRDRLAAEAPSKPRPKPRTLNCLTHRASNAVKLEALELLPKIHWDTGIDATWTPGEAQGQKMLKSFVTSKLEHYSNGRNFPSHDVLSRVSPYLHYGEVSPNQIWHAVDHSKNNDDNVEKFISEVCWRDFAYSVMHHFPQTITGTYNERLKKLKWRKDVKLLRRWQQGQTGIPIVDAGMRQLWQTGYMHNRARMITASFLTKNLLIDWKTGADWFLDCLVDADLAVNTMNWQWVAGTGLDAAPFFRVFNPVLQSKKYDADGEYIRQYVPELKELPVKYIHEPWSAPVAVLEKAKIKLGTDYPKPCVDLKESAQAALDAYHKTA